MSMPRRTILGLLGVISLALVAAGTLLVNWGTVFKNVTTAWHTQALRTEATIFRWGELMSISAELKTQFGAEPDLTYDTATAVRTLNIRFSNYQIPKQVTIESHAREIAAFAIGKTTKSKHVDVVRVLFQESSGKEGVEATEGSRSFTFALHDLMPGQPQAGSMDPDHSTAD